MQGVTGSDLVVSGRFFKPSGHLGTSKKATLAAIWQQHQSILTAVPQKKPMKPFHPFLKARKNLAVGVKC